MHKSGYLGFINLFFLGCALLHKPLRQRLIPWIAIFVFFVILRLGPYLSYNGTDHLNIVLPEGILSDWIPAVFGAIGIPMYYHPAVVVPLAVLSCFGLAALLRSKPKEARVPVVLASTLIMAFEFYTPREGYKFEANKTAFTHWIFAEPDNEIKLINLPGKVGNPHYYLYLQTLTGVPHAYGFSSRTPQSGRPYIKGNLLLSNWDNERSVHCLPHNERAFTSALNQLLADGFTHVVVHNWRYGDHLIMHSFANVPASYNDGSVSVFRLSDMRLSCQNASLNLPRFRRFVESLTAAPVHRTAIVSYHPSEGIEAESFAYLNSLFAEWQTFLHFYHDDSKLVTQNAGRPFTDAGAFASENQVVFLLYNARDSVEAPSKAFSFLDQFDLCQRHAHDDGSVIEHYVSPVFSCDLVNAADPFQVRYDNGARLENVVVKAGQDSLDVQFMWSSLPSETLSVSLQVFDRSGAKVLGQDSVIGQVSHARSLVDISSLPPGVYSVKLILYDFSTGVSVPASGAGAPFARELEIARIERASN